MKLGQRSPLLMSWSLSEFNLECEVQVDVASALGDVLVNNALLLRPDGTADDLQAPHNCCVILRQL
jgi:hypothetical protein